MCESIQDTFSSPEQYGSDPVCLGITKMIRRLIVNTSSNLTAMVVKIILTFIMTPIYVRMLGIYDYGLREMIVALTGYMGLLSLGMQPTVSRFCAKYNAINDRESLLSVYTTSLVFMTILGFFLATVFTIWAIAWPDLIAPEGVEDFKYIIFLLLTGAYLLFLFPEYVTESCLEGLQRYYIRDFVRIIFGISLATIAYIYITPENGLILLATLTLIITIIKLFIFVILLRKPAMGSVYFDLKRFSLSQFKKMLSFGLKSFIQGASSVVERASDRLVIGSILGPASVPIYSIPASLVNYLSGITHTITHAFMPLFSDLDALKDQEYKIKRIYLFASKIVVSFLLPASAGAMILGGPFIEVWLHGQFTRTQVDGIIILLTLYIAIPLLNPFTSRYLTAVDKHIIFAKVAPVAALANLGLSIWMVMEYGVIGAALGSVIPVFFIMPIYLVYTCYNLQISVADYIKQAILPSLFPTTIMVGIIMYLRAIWELSSYLEILACTVIGSMIYLIIFWFVSLKSMERGMLLSLLFKRR